MSASTVAALALILMVIGFLAGVRYMRKESFEDRIMSGIIGMALLPSAVGIGALFATLVFILVRTALS